ncbi:MAG: hypothetical protein V3T40_04315, partial [Nitrososphaerales archaeon]
YEITVKKDRTQQWKSMGNIKNIGPETEYYDKFLEAMAIVIGNEAGVVYTKYKRGKIDKTEAKNELIKLLDR